MKTKLAILIHFFIFFLHFPSFGQNQKVINQNWEKEIEFQSELFEFSNSLVDDQGNIYHIGNETMSSGQIVLTLKKLSSKEGNIIWEKQWSCASCLVSAGINLVMNGNNIYTVGIVQTNSSSSGIDILVQKYSSETGTEIWTTIFNAANKSEFPVDLTVTNNSVIVTGTTESPTNSFDIFTASLAENSGSLNWVNNYDYIGFDETAIEVRVQGSIIEVLGASSINSSDWEAVLLRYNSLGGNISILRSGVTDLDRNQPLSYLLNGNNLFVGGSAINNSTNNQDAYVKKFIIGINNITIDWNKAIDFDGRTETLEGIKSNTNGDIYLIGLTENNNTSWTWIQSIQNTNGYPNWRNIRPRPIVKNIINGQSFHVNDNGEALFIISSKGDGKETIILTQCDSIGNIEWEQPIVSSNNSIKATNLIVKNDTNIFVSSLLTNDENQQSHYLSTFEYYDKPNTIIYKNDGTPYYIKEDIIIRFSPCVLDTSFIDNHGLKYGRVSEVVTNEILIEELDSLLGGNGSIENWRLFKIFSTFDTNVSSIDGRLGYTVKVPPIWATLVLEIPQTSEIQIKEPILIDSLFSTISRNKIQYSHPNFIGTFPSPTDEFYSEQVSMLNSIVGVNMEQAWDILDNAGWTNNLYTDGIDIALFDTGVRFQHEDLRCPGCPGIIPIDGGDPSIVMDALSFTNFSYPLDFSLEPADIQDGFEEDVPFHGTRSAGVISAIRNNLNDSKGIAGITSNPDHSIRLHSYRINTSSQSGTVLTNLVNSLGFFLNCQETLEQEYDCDSRPQLDLACLEVQFEPTIIGISEEEIELLREVTEIVYDAQYIQSTARGNMGDEDEIFPASFEDRWLTSVGASGTDGALVVRNQTDGSDDYGSNFGDDMDLIAPGISNLVYSTSSESNTSYSTYSGTSAALPHVTGVTAMLMAHHPTPLAQEDVEHLLEYTATDVGLITGFDDENGWGRLNAGSALDFIDPNGENFRVVQVDIDGQLSSDDDPFGCGSNCIISFSRPENDLEDVELPNALIYNGKIIKYYYDFSIDLSAYGLTPPPTAIGNDPNKLPFWTRSSATGLWFMPDFNPNDGDYKFTPDNHLFFENSPQFNGNLFEGTISGYAIEITGSNQSENIIINCGNECSKIANSSNPVNINECYYGEPRLSFSFLARNPVNEIDPIVITDIEELSQKKEKNHLSVFPNPTSSNITIEIGSEVRQEGILNIVDLQGKIVERQVIKLSPNTMKQIELNSSNYPTGIYLVNFISLNSIITAKFVKQ